ncbi:MAG: hypothetical protein NTV74_06420 [Euryarchaeota archaeon]|nr:hypothetical protein [Euryarchaeota archaeon]
MKKKLLIIGICALFVLMPTLVATPGQNSAKKIKPQIEVPSLPTPVLDDYDGTFVGAIGRVYKAENGSWVKEARGYLAGVYKSVGKYKRVLGYLYNLNQTQVGYIGFISANKFLVGKIKNMQNQSAPIVGFIFYNEEYFIGRIMSFFGPAPHIWGAYTPN